MKPPASLTCITCGLPANNLTQLNRMPNGQTCPTCRDRLLETLPPALPGFSKLVLPSGEVDEGEDEQEDVAPHIRKQAEWERPNSA